jgi:Cu-Zn family superoxide dismutase
MTVKMRFSPLVAVLVVAGAVLFGCAGMSNVRVGVDTKVSEAVAVLRPAEGQAVHGTVSFIQEGRDVRVVAEIRGLTPGKHGIHIHEFGDITSADGTSVGGHLNPRNKPHGGPDTEERHIGDLGNVEADRNGVARYNRIDTVISLDGPNAIVGRSVVIKAGPDDFKTQPGGGAGARIAWGVIGIAGLASE